MRVATGSTGALTPLLHFHFRIEVVGEKVSVFGKGSGVYRVRWVARNAIREKCEPSEAW